MRRLLLLLPGLLVLLACSLSSTAPAAPARVPVPPTMGSVAKPTELPPVEKPLATLETSSSAPLGGLLDDFSDQGSGWNVTSGKEGSVGYANGEYVIQVDAVNYSLLANPGRAFGDVLIGVKTQLTEGSPPADMGVICRYQDADNFIYGEVTSDGFYGISQMKKGDLSVLTGGGKLQRHAAIRKALQANQLKFLCADNRYTLLVNDQFVDSVEADAPVSGDVGLIAGTFETPGARVRFDDFSAIPPPPGADTVTVQPGGTVLFADDFSDPTSGWDVRETANGASGYRDGRYFIRVDRPKQQLWSSPSRPFQGGVAVEVTASLARGPKKSEMGVICRYQDAQNFIYGSVGADGYYAIAEIKDDHTTILTGDGKFRQSDRIPTGSETYVIRLVCDGDRYALFVDGEEIDSANSSAFSRGDSGLLGGTFDQGGVEILFDDFKVSTP